MFRFICVGLLGTAAWTSIILGSSDLREASNGDFKLVFALLLGVILGSVTAALDYGRQRSRERAEKYKREKRSPKMKFPGPDRDS